MVSFPPLAPSALWVARFLKEYSTTGDKQTGIEKANAEINSPKEFGRFVLVDTKGDRKIQSLALEGGGRQLRSLNKLSLLKLSEHGDWRRVHLGAIESILGRKPFYRELESPLRKVYDNQKLRTLEEINMAIFEVIFSFLMENIDVAQVTTYQGSPVINERGKEIAEYMIPEVSILQALASHGKETLLGLLAIEKD